MLRMEMDGEEFAGQLRPFLDTRTSHFLHELVSFARSPLNMAAYDHSVRYEWPRGSGRARDEWDPEATVNSLSQQLQDSPSLQGLPLSYSVCITHLMCHGIRMCVRTYVCRFNCHTLFFIATRYAVAFTVAYSAQCVGKIHCC